MENSTLTHKALSSLGFAAVLAFTPAVFAQGMGLDLNDPGPESQETEEGSDSSEATPEEVPPPRQPTTSADAPTRTPSLGEREITQEDRVKSVQNKVYLKKGRFELAPFVSFSVNDPYYSKFGAAIRGAYYLADTLALSLRGNFYQVLPTDDVRTAKRVFQSQIYYSEPQWSGMADVEWSPLYGKVAWYNSILHFDAYLLAGAGVVYTATSALDGRGPNVAADLGVGARFVAMDYLAVNVALINTSYVDQPVGTTKSAMQNLMTVNAGISLFFPFKSTGRESE